MLSTEELLNPRYKVIADYPCSEEHFEINDVLELGRTGYIWCNTRTKQVYYGFWPDRYPHLFKPLSWWEDRRLEDMPEYVKSDGDVWQQDYKSVDGKLFFNQYCNGHRIGWLPVSFISFNELLPATESEYLNQSK